MLRAVLVIVFTFPVAADERSAFFGAWGTPKQCARAAIKPGGTVLAQPFEIDSEWLRHGTTFCRLDWFSVDVRENEVFSGAHAQCGEDSVIDYMLGMRLTDDGLLLRWNFLTSNGPLLRCDKTAQ